MLLFRFHQRDKWPYGDTERNRAAAGRAKKLNLQSPRRDLKEPQGSENWYEKVHYQVAKHTSGRRGHVPEAFGRRARPFRSPRSSPRCFRSSPHHPIPPVSAATLSSGHPLSSSNGSSGSVAPHHPAFPAAEFQITADLRGFVQSDYPAHSLDRFRTKSHRAFSLETEEELDRCGSQTTRPVSVTDLHYDEINRVLTNEP